MTPDEVEQILKQGADDLGSAGVDNTFGYGRINVFGSLQLIGGGGPTLPVADFVGSPISGNAPLEVEFRDLSAGAPTSWLWDFGDSGTSNAQNPTHVFNDAGIYTVSLTVTNASGADMLVRENYITVTSGGGFSGEGFILSRNADFSTDDRTFAANETLYMLVWTDQVDFNNIKRAEWELRAADRSRVKGTLTNRFDNSYTAAFDLSGLPSGTATWKGKVEDNARNKFQPTTMITIQP